MLGICPKPAAMHCFAMLCSTCSAKASHSQMQCISIAWPVGRCAALGPCLANAFSPKYFSPQDLWFILFSGHVPPKGGISVISPKTRDLFLKHLLVGDN